MNKLREGYHPLIELTIVRVKETVREPEAVFWIFVFPVLFAIGLGIAFREQNPEKLVIAVDNRMKDKTEIAETLSRSGRLKTKILSPEGSFEELRTGKVALVLSRSPELNFREKTKGKNLIVQNSGVEFFLIYDPTRSESQLARLAVNDVLQQARGRKDVVLIQEQEVREPGARYIDFLIPGLVGMNLMGSGMWGVGFAIVYARTRKLLKRFAATPMKRSHFLLAFMLSRLIFLVWEVGMVVACGWLFFEVRVYGSILDLTFLAIIGALTFAGMGLLVASRASTIESASGWMNFIMLPMYLLSGCFFSYSRFPEFMHPLIRALPLTALNDAMRAVINQGNPLFQSWLELLVLGFWAVVSFGIALKIFKWQ